MACGPEGRLRSSLRADRNQEHRRALATASKLHDASYHWTQARRKQTATLFSDEARQNRFQPLYRGWRPQLPVGH